MPDAPAPQPEPEQARDAILFVPGIGTTGADKSSDGFAIRLARALQWACPDDHARFEVETDGRDEVFRSDAGDNNTVGVRTIVRRDGSTRVPVIDVYARDYSSRLTRAYEQSNLFVKSLILAFMLARYTIPVVRSLGYTTGKDWREKLQLLWAGGLLSVLWVYMLILAVAVVSSVLQIFDVTAAVNAELARWSQRFAVLGAFVMAVWPKIQRDVTRAAVLYICAIRYMSDGDRRTAMAGDLTDVLTHMLQKKSRYQNVHVVAYSFGTVVTLDTMYPFGQPPAERFSRIDTLITVGSPFDLVRTYWPGYFEARSAAAGMKARWLNIYSPVDVLGSNFRNDSKKAGPLEGKLLATNAATKDIQPTNLVYQPGPAPESPGFLGILSLTGLWAHATYWDAADAGAVSCFSLIVDQVYRNDPILANTPAAGATPRPVVAPAADKVGP